ncbi:SDR family NAD(P)-dependent oxidoreductase [Mailhella massiliensis]|uniref:SDR family oxidoreductase n=1 Tax=Mailhella massiliensis TaxID=1903261 RepID=A0A921AUL9_9BACT|nr:SDR family NAD(P)-dependent oxidoreductase [Mailhella massiliensis]HJD96097.1 SDR family oxidoreductase [Mailhella massiliensis]
MTDLTGKTAIVTAGSKGIGLACAQALAKHGATVFVAARNEKEGEEAVCGIRKQGGRAFFLRFDATRAEDYPRLMDTAARKDGRLDILVNNYGSTDTARDKDLLEGDSEAFFRIVRANIQSVYLSCRRAVPFMKESGGGSIINISSIGSRVPDVSRLAYTLSKAAINALTQNIALQYARDGIRCNAVLPGLIATDAALRNMPESFLRSFLRHVPLGRMGTPEDVANAVLYFAGDASSYVTGALHEVAGGYALGTPQYAEYASPEPFLPGDRP